MGPQSRQALVSGSWELEQLPCGALDVLCFAPGLLLLVSQGPVHSWLQHIPCHPHHCHGHPLSFPVRPHTPATHTPAAFRVAIAQSPGSVLPTPTLSPGYQPWRTLRRCFPHPYTNRWETPSKRGQLMCPGPRSKGNLGRRPPCLTFVFLVQGTEATGGESLVSQSHGARQQRPGCEGGCREVERWGAPESEPWSWPRAELGVEEGVPRGSSPQGLFFPRPAGLGSCTARAISST